MSRTARILASVLVVGFAAAPGPASATPGASLAGYQAQALAAAGRFEINSPGLLPLGDPAVGTIVETDLPFARSTVDPGPVVDALGSPLYPGDTVAHLGTVFSTFGAPGVPNEPVLAEAQYPPAPGFKATASFGAPSTAARPATAESSANENGARASSSINSFGLPGVFGVGGSEVSNTLTIAQSSIDSNAVASLGTIDIAGVVQIAGMQARASATSDGTTAKPSASLQIGRVTVAGQAAFVDQDGIHLATSKLGAGVTTTLSNLLNKTLATLGISVKTVAATIKSDGPTASADSGGLEITMTQHTPGILNVPGVPVIRLPGPLPTIGPGIPPLVEQVVLVMGQAHAAVNATLAPSFDLGGGPAGTGLVGSSTTPTTTTQTLAPGGPGASAPAALAASGTPSATGTGGGNQPQVAGGPSFRATPSRVILGVPVRVAQVLAALLGVIAGAGVLLGYARWQLLTGRSRVR
jgi:hypothetical protein